MAGDWIKMRTNLWDDPRVSMICDQTGQGEAAVIGALYWLWSAADEHSEDGIMVGLSISGIDRKTGVKGIGAALVDVGWLADHPEGIRIIRFDEHNGASAKKRILTARRVANFKSGNAEVTPDALPDQQEGVTDALPMRDLDVDVDVEKSKQPKPKSRAGCATASRLPADWVPSSDDVEFCKSTRPDLDAVLVGESFRDYWLSAAGAKGRKADWPATWRNWVRNEKGPKARAGPVNYGNTRDADRKEVGDVLTGRKKQNERTATSERDITGESRRVA